MNPQASRSGPRTLSTSVWFETKVRSHPWCIRASLNPKPMVYHLPNQQIVILVVKKGPCSAQPGINSFNFYWFQVFNRDIKYANNPQHGSSQGLSSILGKHVILFVHFIINSGKPSSSDFFWKICYIPISFLFCTIRTWLIKCHFFGTINWLVLSLNTNTRTNHYCLGVSINGGTPKCMVYIGKSYSNGWFRGITSLGNPYLVTWIWMLFPQSGIYSICWLASHRIPCILVKSTVFF